jgi:molybdopterin molybdotransferase
MLSLDEASRRLLARARLTDPEEVSLAEAVARVLVDPVIVAPNNVPPFDNSAMDGYALRAEDTPGDLALVGEIAAGAGGLLSVEPGQAVRIMTGAPMPPGADTVVPIEHAVEDGAVVRVTDAARRGQHVRATGHDTAAGSEVCLAGELTPAMIGVLATLGMGRVAVRRRPVVAIVSTGDELAEPGGALGPGQIHDANTPALVAACLEAGAEPHAVPRLADDAAAIEAALDGAAREVDLIVSSGGVSVGRYDHVRAVLEARGRLDLWRISVQPGKPVAVGSVDGTTLVGLPGNPVSALVTFELLVRPLLRAMVGLRGDGRERVRARPVELVPKDRDRRAFLRVVLEESDDGIAARPAGGQGSSQLRAMADANALLVVPEGEEAADPGHHYEAIVLRPIIHAPAAPAP